jgi:hypothetical protein
VNNTVTISDYNDAHRVVDRSPNLFWDGWTIVEFRNNPDASSYKNGMYRNGKWGTARRYEPSRDGWTVPKRYV